MLKQVKSWEAEVERILPLVDKPAQYLGGEYNSTEKDWTTLSATMYCFSQTFMKLECPILVCGCCMRR